MINMGYFIEQKKRIENAGPEELVAIKKELINNINPVVKGQYCGERPMATEYALYLDILCDVKLGAMNWKGGLIVIDEGSGFDLLVDWYELLATVARSVNQRQKDGRGGCNERKFNELYDFTREHSFDKEETCKGKYAGYLYSRFLEIMFMRNKGEWSTLEKIDAFSSKYA